MPQQLVKKATTPGKDLIFISVCSKSSFLLPSCLRSCLFCFYFFSFKKSLPRLFLPQLKHHNFPGNPPIPSKKPFFSSISILFGLVLFLFRRLTSLTCPPPTLSHPSPLLPSTHPNFPQFPDHPFPTFPLCSLLSITHQIPSQVRPYGKFVRFMSLGVTMSQSVLAVSIRGWSVCLAVGPSLIFPIFLSSGRFSHLLSNRI